VSNYAFPFANQRSILFTNANPKFILGITQIGIIFHVLHPKPPMQAPLSTPPPHPHPPNGDAIRKNIFLKIISKNLE
jgi:hypothetical protein